MSLLSHLADKGSVSGTVVLYDNNTIYSPYYTMLVGGLQCKNGQHQYHNELKCPNLSTLLVAKVDFEHLCTLLVLVDAEDPCLVYLDRLQTLR